MTSLSSVYMGDKVIPFWAVWRNTDLSLGDTWETVRRELGDNQQIVHTKYLISTNFEARISTQ